jgi:signal transduction histidine kinase
MPTSPETPVRLPFPREDVLDAARRRDEVLGAFAREILASRNLAELLHLAARVAAEGANAEVSAVWSVAGDDVRLDVSFGVPEARERIARALLPLAESAIREGRPRRLAARDATADEVAIRGTWVVPISAYERVRGAIGIHGVPGAEGTDEEALPGSVEAFLTRLADLVALAMDQAERCEAVRRLEHTIEEMRRAANRHEDEAEMAETRARAFDEARRSLISVGAFARRAANAGGDAQALEECLEAIRREVSRVEQRLEERRERTAAAPGFGMVTVNGLLQHSLNQVRETLVRRRVRLTKNFQSDLPPLLLDAGRLQTALDRVLAVALESVAPGGRLRLETRRTDEHVVLEVAHDGLRVPGDALEQLFAALDGMGPRAAGSGLALARQIVRSHGGELSVRCHREWSSIATITLPCAGNRDRRSVGSERRRTRRDRRGPVARFDSTRG